MSNVNLEEVERLVGELQKGLANFGKFEGQDGLSATLTFAYRFSRSLTSLAPKEDRANCGKQIAASFRLMAARIEMETMDESKEQVH